jgi:hypothetical protein
MGNCLSYLNRKDFVMGSDLTTDQAPVVDVRPKLWLVLTVWAVFVVVVYASLSMRGLVPTEYILLAPMVAAVLVWEKTTAYLTRPKPPTT